MPGLGRLALAAAYAAVGLVALSFVAHDTVAAAVAMAPNAARPLERLVPTPIPAALYAAGGYVARTRVGPPEATLSYWVVPPRLGPPKATLLLLHGIRMDKRSLVRFGTSLSDAGYRAVLVDLRGHGESTGRYLTYGAVEARDLSAVLDALGESGERRTGVFGFSYGAAVGIELAARDARIGAVVAVAPFSTLREVTLDYRRRYLPAIAGVVPDSWFQSALDDAGEFASFDPDAAAPLRSVTRTDARLLFVHGTADTQVPLRHSVALARAAGRRAELLEIPGATHGDMPSDASGAIRRAARGWFDRVL